MKLLKFIATLVLFGGLFSCENDTGVKIFLEEKPTPQKQVVKTSEPKKNTAKIELPPPKKTSLFAWKAPQQWKSQKLSAMRMGSYQVGKTGDCSIFFFPGTDVGGLLANVNRWRKEMSLPSIAEKQLDTVGKQVKVAGFSALFIDFAGKYTKGVGMGFDSKEQSGYRMLGIIALTQHGTLFIKLVGPKTIVDQEVARFESFYKSFTFTGKK